MTAFNLIQSEVQQNKVFYLDGSGNLAKKTLKFAKYYTSQEVKAGNLREFHAKLLAILAVPAASYYSVLRGAWVDDELVDLLDDMRLHRLAEAGKTGRDPKKGDLDVLSRVGEKGKTERLRRGDILEDVPRHWVCFDFDKVLVGDLGPFDVANPTPWVDRLVESELGGEFLIADKLIHLSSSAGLGDEVSAHVWFWLPTAMDGAAWRAWFAERTRVLGRKPYIDKGLFEKERIHYIAPPEFKGEAPDPCSGTSRLVFSEGLEDCVYLSDVSAYLNASSVAAELREARGFQITDGEVEEAQDAWSRPGLVGAFNRVYSISDVIERFLSEHYRVDTDEGRVTWLGSESKSLGGCKIFANNTKMFSTHASCPFGGDPRNAFDLVEYWLFEGSFMQTARWVETIPEVVAERDRVDLDVFGDLGPSEDFASEIAVTDSEPVKIEVTTPESLLRDYPIETNLGGGNVGRYELGSDGAWFFGYDKAEEDGEDDFNFEEDTKKKKKGKKKSGGKGGFVRLWSPVTIVNDYICAVSGDHTTKFKVRSADGRAIEMLLPSDELEPNKLSPALKKKGWRVEGSKNLDFCRLANIRSKIPNIYVVQKRGWVEPPAIANSDSLGFALPSGRVIGSSDWSTEHSLELRSDLIMKPRISSAGTLEGWKSGIAKLCEIENVPHWILGAVMGFAGPLVELLDAPTSGFAICGSTSRGKSTAMGIAASIWSTPSERKGGMFRTLNSTDNAVESAAVAANGTILILDETNIGDGRNLEPLIYRLATGVGKLRLDKNSHARETTSWSTFGLITGELGVSEKYEQASPGKKMGKGAALRFLDMDISGFNPSVELWRIKDFLRILNENYGVAGPEFIKCLIRERHHIDNQELLRLRTSYAVKLCGGSEGGIKGRGAEVLSLVWLGACLADKWQITPEGFLNYVEEAIAEMWNQFMGGAVANSDDRTIDSIRLWLAGRLNNTIVPVGSTERSSGAREGWYDEEIVYLPTSYLMEASGGITRAKELVALLAKRGLLIPRSPSKMTHGYIPSAGWINHYRLSRVGDYGFLPNTEISTEGYEF